MVAFVEQARSFSRQAFAARKGAIGALGADYAVFLAAAGMVVIFPFLFVWQSPSEFWEEGRWTFVGSLAIFLFFSSLGLFVAFKAMFTHNREFRVAAKIFAKVKSDLAKLDGDKDVLKPADIEPSHYVPEGDRDTACAKLVEKHFDAASSLRSDDGIAALVIANDLNIGRGTLGTLSAFALRVGILLTFFGLLVGLAPIGSALETSEKLAEVPIGKLLSGLTISFTSSIAGLSAALVIGVLLQATNRSFFRLKSSIDDLALALRQVYSKVRFGGDISKTVDHLTKKMQNHAREMDSHGVQVERSVNQASRAFQEHAKESGRIMSDVARSTEDLISISSEHKDAISRVSETIATLSQFEAKWTDHVDNLINKSSASLKEHSDALTTSFVSNFDSIQTTLVEQQKSDREELQNALNSLADVTKTVSKTLDSVSAAQKGKDEKISKALLELDASIRGIEGKRARGMTGWGRSTKLLILLFIGTAAFFGWPYIEELLPSSYLNAFGLT